uniref:Homeobox domain-containing protein n=1 Tax=Rhabditophanes sp. KR3021 TaxID=114890 RepID=A0AC35TU02_9BILA
MMGLEKDLLGFDKIKVFDEIALARLNGYFNRDQLEAIAESLYREGDGGKIVRFLKSVHCVMIYFEDSAIIKKTYLAALLYTKKFTTLYEIISSRRFEEKDYPELQMIWYEAKYAESEFRKQKPLGPVEKYRLRKKHPFPSTIWDGQETVYSFKTNSRSALRAFYDQNKYPNTEDKRQIAKMTGLKVLQISNWFKNRRQRDKSGHDGFEFGMNNSAMYYHPYIKYDTTTV